MVVLCWFVVVIVWFFCGFNGGLCYGLCGGCVVDDEENKHAKTKKNCSGVLLIFFSLKTPLLFCGKTSFIYRNKETWETSYNGSLEIKFWANESKLSCDVILVMSLDDVTLMMSLYFICSMTRTFSRTFSRSFLINFQFYVSFLFN